MALFVPLSSPSVMYLYGGNGPRTRPRYPTVLASGRAYQPLQPAREAVVVTHDRPHQVACVDVQLENAVPPRAFLPARLSTHCTPTPRALRARRAGYARAAAGWLVRPSGPR